MPHKEKGAVFGLASLLAATLFCSAEPEFRTRERLSRTSHNLLPVPLPACTRREHWAWADAPQDHGSFNPFGTEHELTARDPRMSPI